MINRACVFSNRTYASQVKEQKFLGLDLCALTSDAEKRLFAFFTTSDMWLFHERLFAI